MWHHFGAAHSCSSFADLVIKNSHTRLQNVRLKNLSFLAKIQKKNRYFCLFFRANLTVLGVLVHTGARAVISRCS
jgi:hypothetical protein